MARLLIQRGVEPMYIDDSSRRGPGSASTDRSGTGGRVQAPGDVTWSDVDVVVRAPGVSRYRPELDRARSHGVAVTTAMALWLEDFADARVVAVTGTKGKSTTAALTAAILGEEGMDVALIGNIGVPVVEWYGRPLVDAYVVEVSSYQAADVEVSPGVVVLTSLAPDHLDWHGGEEAVLPGQAPARRGRPAGSAGRERRQRRGRAAHRAPPGPDAVRTGRPGPGGRRRPGDRRRHPGAGRIASAASRPPQPLEPVRRHHRGHPPQRDRRRRPPPSRRWWRASRGFPRGVGPSGSATA